MHALEFLRRLGARLDDTAGQTALVLTVPLFLFACFGVLAVDFGLAYAERREAQNAVDFAALAAAATAPESETVKREAALAYLAANDVDLADADVTAAVSFPDADRVEVSVARSSPWRFLSLFGVEERTTGARAVARLHTQPGEYGIMALDASACEAFYVDGTVRLRVVGGGILVNSDCGTNALSITGQVTVESAAFDHYYAGGTYITENTSVSPLPQPLSRRVDDPLASVAEPSLAALPMSPDSGGTAASPALRSIGGGGSLTVRPGVYYGGLALSGSKDITFQPGIYAMAGGGFTVSGNGEIRGDGVLIFNTTYDGACGPISLSGGRPVEFTPPQSGPYEGITFWQSASCSQTMLHAGTVDSLAGLIYLPGAHYELAGTGTMSGVQVIASTVEVRGNGNITIDYTGYATAQTWVVSLVE